ncbi:glycine oxidase ThiO [Virgisporangium ochraceum]|uniref:glycine oxidase n=1 Tax=Virgisporangium ochraceum TaxID=65505 RepID=A0A8J4EHG6_9ACTN|nr:glycine oxidase ThiO [Virgisporangium ochraceum]GIJ74964.1 glycine oxidase ThiO [Virgisporangium ochraceum]
MSRVAVVGGGVIGLAIAWRCAERGHEVRVYDPAPGSGATGVAAGMLAPTGEARFGEEPLHRLLLAAAARWPAFAAELASASRIDLSYRNDGTVLVAGTDDDLRAVRRLVDFHRRSGLPVRPLTAAEVRDREPLLSPRVRGGAFLPGDGQVDPRRVARALLAALPEGTVVTGGEWPADLTVLAAGHATADLVPGLPVRPVKGQIARLRGDGLTHVIRGQVANRSVYIVPRADGEVVVGATEEERGTDTTVTAGGVLDLLRPAVALVPALAEYELVETSAGLRPGTPDNAPLVGEVAPGTVVATGHYRDGVLLAPVTADAIVTLLDTGELPELFRPFSPDRFAEVAP